MGMACWATAQNICHDDGTVTFQYKNDQAKSVQVDVQFAGRNDMKRNAETGLWEVTLGPAAPDMYPYCFIVDGVSVMDPRIRSTSPTRASRTRCWRFLPRREVWHTTSRTCPMDVWSIFTTTRRA